MRVAVVHGYFLHDSGSGVYVRELARALVALGHEVTLVCQDRQPERCDFIDTAFELAATNSALTTTYRAERTMAGSCRLVRPDLGGDLLVYIDGAFPPFEPDRVHTFQGAAAAVRGRYIDRNVRALRTTFASWPPDLVLAQHIIMQPYVVRKALDDNAPYVVTEHGSALNFSVRSNDDLVPFATAGLAGAARIATVSDDACRDLTAWASEHGLPIAATALPPGIDAGLFSPAADRDAAIAALDGRVGLPADFKRDDDIVAFAGSLRPTKGVQHLVAAMPLVARLRGRPTRLFLAGDGPARAALEGLDALVVSGDIAGAERLVRSEEVLQSPPEWGDVVQDLPTPAGGRRAVFLGHISHRQLAAVLAVADVCVTPSVFPEAAALVSIEALSTGAVPLAAYHSGMVGLDDLLAEAMNDSAFTSIVPGVNLTRHLAELIAHVLDTYPTKDPAFRQRLHELAGSRYPSWDRIARDYVGMVGD